MTRIKRLGKAKWRRKEPIKYKVFPLRLSQNTIDEFKKQRSKSGLSWNLFVYKILIAYYAQKK